MQTLRTPRLLSPTKRPLRICKPLPKNIPLLSNEADTLLPKREKVCSSSTSPKKLYTKRTQDYDLCSSGAVLVLAKKVKDNERTINRGNAFKKTEQNWRRFQNGEDDVFSQRSQQKYRIRSRGRSYEKTQSTLVPQTAPDCSRMETSEWIDRQACVASIEPWNLSMECEQLSDLF